MKQLLERLKEDENYKDLESEIKDVEIMITNGLARAHRTIVQKTYGVELTFTNGDTGERFSFSHVEPKKSLFVEGERAVLASISKVIEGFTRQFAQGDIMVSLMKGGPDANNSN